MYKNILSFCDTRGSQIGLKAHAAWQFHRQPRTVWMAQNTPQMLRKKKTSEYCSMSKTGDRCIMSYSEQSFFFLPCTLWLLFMNHSHWLIAWIGFYTCPGKSESPSARTENYGPTGYKEDLQKFTILETGTVKYYLRCFWKSHRNSILWICVGRHFPQRQFEHFLKKTFVPDNPFKS